MIKLEQVDYRYSGGTAFAMQDVTLTVEPGTVFTLLGPNGAGKTTLIRILSGLILPTKGSVEICGHDVVKDEYKARSHIGLVLGDERTFYYRLSGSQNLEFFGGLAGLKRKDLRKRISEVLELVNLAESAHLTFMKYSTGMRKRLNLARALLNKPRVYLLDEPNSGIDPASARTIRQIISELRQQGCTILMTTHYMEEAERMSDQIGFLKDGCLARIGSLSEFKKDFNKRKFSVQFRQSHDHLPETLLAITRRLRQEANCDDIALTGSTIEISFNGSADINRLLTIIGSVETEVTSIKMAEVTLEDVFLRLAGADHV